MRAFLGHACVCPWMVLRFFNPYYTSWTTPERFFHEPKLATTKFATQSPKGKYVAHLKALNVRSCLHGGGTTLLSHTSNSYTEVLPGQFSYLARCAWRVTPAQCCFKKKPLGCRMLLQRCAMQLVSTSYMVQFQCLEGLGGQVFGLLQTFSLQRCNDLSMHCRSVCWNSPPFWISNCILACTLMVSLTVQLWFPHMAVLCRPNPFKSTETFWIRSRITLFWRKGAKNTGVSFSYDQKAYHTGLQHSIFPAFFMHVVSLPRSAAHQKCQQHQQQTVII